jgi:hypothetical protein
MPRPTPEEIRELIAERWPDYAPAIRSITRQTLDRRAHVVKREERVEFTKSREQEDVPPAR